MRSRWTCVCTVRKICLQTHFFAPFSCRQEREASFAQKKAERATVRSHFRDKYRLPKVKSASAEPKSWAVSPTPSPLLCSKLSLPLSPVRRRHPPTCLSTAERVGRDPDPAGGGWRGSAHGAGQDDRRGQPGGDAQAVGAGSAVQHPERGHRPAERQSPGHTGRPQKADGELQSHVIRPALSPWRLEFYLYKYFSKAELLWR